jgi:3-hydroxybutyrate dehydrogenase
MKNILITGSTSGIGLGIARFFARAGHNIVFNGLESNGAEIAKGIGTHEFEVKTMFSPANMLKTDEIYEMVKEAEAHFGNIDVLINNAGIQYVAPIDEFPTENGML